MMAIRPRRGGRRAMTLIELLVVISVIVLLAAAAAPLMKNTLEGQKVRAASRQLNVFAAAARGRAAELGRSVGLLIQRYSEEEINAANGAALSMRVFVAETPPPYCGDFQDVRAQLLDLYPLNNTDGMADTAQFGATSASLPFLVQSGDRIKFDFSGPRYQITQIVPANPLLPGNPMTVSFRLPEGAYDPGADLAWGNAGVDDDLNGAVDDVSEAGWAPSDDIWLSPPAPQRAGSQVAYQVFRRPTKSMAMPLDLPNGIVIDLTVSGMGAAGTEFAPRSPLDTTPILIMFNPQGYVESVEYSGVARRPMGTIHLLLGRGDRVFPADPSNPSTYANPFTHMEDDREHVDGNLLNTESLWVSIGHRTGGVTSEQNAQTHEFDPEIGFVSWSSPPTVLEMRERVAAARWFARSAQSMGGL